MEFDAKNKTFKQCDYDFTEGVPKWGYVITIYGNF